MTPSLSEEKIELRLLGGFEARHRGQMLAGISYTRMRALLAYLAMDTAQAHRREPLAELLWANNDAATARGNLRRTLSDLRRVLATTTTNELFTNSKDSVAFINAPYVDALAFTGQAYHGQDDQSAIALYRGEFLAGLTLPDSPAFEDWLQIQRENMHRHALALLERLAKTHEQRSDYQQALPFALRHCQLEPWSEEAHRRVMRLYALNGQQSAALDQYQACCRQLDKELAVEPGVETRQLCEAIRRGELLPLQLSQPGSREKPGHRQTASERRQVTVLYCELNQLGSDDPDEFMDFLRAPQARCTDIIRQFSGHIVQAHGGGLLAYFGYPQADEHAARHALAAALAISGASTPHMEIKVALHSGLIVSGGEATMPDSAGRTSRLAIHLRHACPQARVVISADTQRLVAGYFTCRSLGQQALPGLSQPLEIFQVDGASGARHRLDALPRLTPLAGRHEEIAHLLDCWRQVGRGQRQIVMLQGDAGIGKSRLLHAVKEQLAGQAHLIREFRCFPEFCQTPFQPLIATLESIFAFAADDSPAEKSRKLANYLDSVFPALANDAIPLLGQLLSLPASADFPAPALPARKQKEQTLTILRAMLQHLASRQPVLLIVEDLHWVDPSTLELLRSFVEQDTTGAVLALLTARNEFVAPWSPAFFRIQPLQPLTDHDAAAMAASLNQTMPAATIRHIVDRADGIPLFVEEMMKIASADSQANIPPTLLDLLAARIDRLGQAKQTAQLAATLGREFDLQWLRKISPETPAGLTESLKVLQESGLVQVINDSHRQFKHALIQEAAYQSQSKTSRQAAHRGIARMLQEDFPEVVAKRPELLAQHLADGDDKAAAIVYWTRAGQRAALNSANLEAIAHFNAALQLLSALPADRERDKTEFNILVSLCPVYYAAKGYGSTDASQANTRLSALSSRVDDSPELFQAKWAQVYNSIAGADATKEEAVSRGLQLLHMVHDDPVRVVAANCAVANAYFWLGEFAAVRQHGEKSIAAYRPDQHQLLVEQFGDDLYVSSASFLSCALYFLGYPDQALRVCQQMLQHARAQPHHHTLGFALCWASMLHRWMNLHASTSALSAEAIALSRQHDLSVWLAVSESIHGSIQILQGQRDAGIAECLTGIAGMRAAMVGLPVTFESPLADALVQTGQYAEALALLAEIDTDMGKAGDDYFAADLLRLKGICLQAGKEDAQAAEACFQQALAISRQQGAKALELRATTSMARLWQQQGRRAEARQLLGEVYAGFSEGFATPDLQDARQLLEALSAAA